MEPMVVLCNQKALAALNEADFSAAFDLLQDNAKKYPCHQTLNNLGKFCCDSGQKQRGGRWKSAKAIGMRYLLRAAEQDKRFPNLFNIGVEMFKRGRYEEAGRYFGEAAALNRPELALYNMGACLLALREFDLAGHVFSRLREGDTAEILSNGGITPSIPLIFSRYLSGESAGTGSAENLDLTDLELQDKMILLYLKGEYKKVVEYIPRLLAQWSPCEELLAMLFDSAEKLGMPEKKEEIIGQLACGAKRARYLAGHAQERNACIQRYTFLPPLVEICGYYGCQVHNTPY